MMVALVFYKSINLFKIVIIDTNNTTINSSFSIDVINDIEIIDNKNILVSDIFFDYNNLIDYHYKLPSGFKDKEFNGIVLEAFKYLDFNKIELDKLPKYFM